MEQVEKCPAESAEPILGGGRGCHSVCPADAAQAAEWSATGPPTEVVLKEEVKEEEKKEEEKPELKPEDTTKSEEKTEKSGEEGEKSEEKPKKSEEVKSEEPVKSKVKSEESVKSEVKSEEPEKSEEKTEKSDTEEKKSEEDTEETGSWTSAMMVVLGVILFSVVVFISRRCYTDNSKEDDQYRYRVVD